MKELTPVTSGVREDDHPSVSSRDGRVWMAWVSYSETEGTSHIYVRSFENGAWSEPRQITESPGDCHKPTIVVDEQSTVWVAWPAQIAGNWDIYGRVRKAGRAWSKTERWTNDAGPDLAPRLAAAGARVMLVWQGMRRNHFDILYRIHSASAWSQEGFVTENPANDWEPVVAATKAGAFFVAWDSYRGDYDVLLRTMSDGRWSEEMPVTHSPRLENRPTLAVDARDRVWIAWEIGPERWASDSASGGLHQRRDIGLACLQNSRLYRAEAAEAALWKLAGEKGMEAPAPAVGRDGRLRLFFRQPIELPAPAGAQSKPSGVINWLSVGMTMWDGDHWTTPEMLLHSEGRVDQRIALTEAGDRILACYPAGSSHNVIYARLYDSGQPAGADPSPALVEARPGSPKALPSPPQPHTLRGFQLAWGDLHRHTDISEDGGILDGSLIETMRYALDAAGLDFIGVTDHTRYLPRRYNLWRMQQVTDLYYKPGVFVPLYAYERSQSSPWGHRNVVHLTRDYVPVPASYDIGDPGVSPWGLFAALRGKKAISIPHTPAWINRQVSWDYNDPEIEPLVEIYQGLRSTYEYNGAPDPADRAVYERDSRNFVWDALARKLKLGFIASSDHRSTHMSFAAVYAKNKDRASIFEALRARRTYAASDKILVDFSIENHWMGEEIRVTRLPELEVAVEGTADLAQIDVIKNNRFVYTTRPAGRAARFMFRDQEYQGEDCYYYLRVIQVDKHMAWASPIWVRGKN